MFWRATAGLRGLRTPQENNRQISGRPIESHIAQARFFAGVTLVPFSRVVGIFSKPLAAHLGAFGPLFSAAAVLLVEWLVLFWMYRRKIFLRA